MKNLQSDDAIYEYPMRVAQILNRMDSGGIESVVINYYRYIDHSKIQFDFFCYEGSNFPQREELMQMGAKIYPIPAYSHPLAYHKALYSVFRANHYQIVHAHLSTMSLFALFAAWRANVPVRICHNHTTAHWSEGKRTLLKYILRPLNKIFATDYFACGEKAARWMYGDQCFNNGHVYLMSNAINVQKFCYDPFSGVQLRKKLGIPEDAFVVGHVGRFMHQKNHMFLLQVFQQVLRKRKNAWLLLIGEGELEQKIKAKAQEFGLLGRVCFPGVRSDVGKLYSAMDVFCLPSFYEGLPVVALEAQANGLPCAFSDQITKEILLTPNSVFLALERPQQWAEQLLLLKRQYGSLDNTRFDIKKAQQLLAEYYLTAAQRIKKTTTRGSISKAKK